ncbi:hypothetical protein B4088_0994 [Bacillus cereus]|uniref:Uncharacterized protein n=1 Tax=Bacillus cereus TaxID=1396 RepID=A0A161R5T1_BACCE|nr:hypothetical protein B4088_0994 [Bacillus cereus]
MWSPICGALFLCYPVNRRGINRELEERRKNGGVYSDRYKSSGP